MKTLREMSDAEIKGMQIRNDGLLKDQAEMMKATPKDTLAFRAMEQSRAMMINFRNRIDDELDRRGF